MDKKMLSWLLVALIILSVSVLPVSAWTYSDCTEDTKYEEFGPRVDNYLIRLYSTETSEWTGLENHEIDMTDWPLTRDYVTKYSNPPYSDYIKLYDYGAEYGFYVINFNCNPYPYIYKPQYSNPMYPCPTSVSSFRHALAHLMDRAHVIEQYWGGYAIPMYTDIAPAQAGCHPQIKPGGALEELTHPYSPTLAAQYLEEDGFPIGPDGWRYWDRNGNGNKDAGEDLVLVFWIRSDHIPRYQLGNWFADQLEADPIKIHVDRRYGTSYQVWLNVMVNKEFNLATAGWSIGVDPDTGDLYSIDYFWHPGFCYNYGAVNCSEFDYWHYKVIYGNTYEEVLEAVLKEQEAFCTPSCIGAIHVCSVGPSIQAGHRTYVGPESPYTGALWTHLVNVQGYGPDSFWSIMNTYPEGYPFGDGEHMTLRRGFKVEELKKLNPVYAEWLWDWEVLGMIYDSLGYRNPYQLLEFKPYLIRDYEAFSWVDPSDGQTKSAVRLYLRQDVWFSDGTIMTASDIYYTYIEFTRKLIGAGYPPPWWYSTVRYMKSFFIIDPYTIEILLDIKTYFAVGWVLGGLVLPRHIWDPILDRNIAGTNPEYEDIEGFAPDPNLIGTGPFRLVEYATPNYISMTANTPLKTVTTNLEGAVPITSGEGYFRMWPIDFEMSPHPGRYAYGGTYNLEFKATNLFADQTYNIMDTDDNVIVTIDPLDTVTLKTVVLTPENSSIAYFYLKIHRIGTCTIPGWWKYEVQLRYKLDGLIDIPIFTFRICLPRWWPIPTCEWRLWRWDPAYWITIKEDIAGGNYYDDVGATYPAKYKGTLPTPDKKVDMKDIGQAAKAFGSYPGHPRWNSIADIDGNYKVEMKDIGAIAKKFGWVG